MNLLNKCIITAYTTNTFKSLETCWSGSQGCPLRFRWVCIEAFFCKHSKSCSLSSVFAHFCMLSLWASLWRLTLGILYRLYLRQGKTKFFRCIVILRSMQTHACTYRKSGRTKKFYLISNQIWLLYWNKHAELFNNTLLVSHCC